MMTGMVITHKDIVLDLLCYGHFGVSSSCRHIVHQLFLIFHCLPSALTRKPFGQACHRRGELVQPGLQALVMHQLYLFGRALCPQSQDLPANQPIIVIIMASLLQQHVIKGFPCHSGNLCALQYYQGFAHPC